MLWAYPDRISKKTVISAFISWVLGKSEVWSLVILEYYVGWGLRLHHGTMPFWGGTVDLSVEAGWLVGMVLVFASTAQCGGLGGSEY